MGRRWWQRLEWCGREVVWRDRTRRLPPHPRGSRDDSRLDINGGSDDGVEAAIDDGVVGVVSLVVDDSFVSSRSRGRRPGSSSCFAVGEVRRGPPHSVIRIADGVGEEDRAIGILPCRNWTKGAVLAKDGDCPSRNSNQWVIIGHFKVDRQLSTGIFCARRTPVKYIHNSALHICFEHIHRAKDVPGGVVTENSVGDGMDDRADPVPWIGGRRHCSNDE